MNNYPIRHTMDFGEVVCPNCGGDGTTVLNDHLGTCYLCNGEGTMPLTVTFELTKNCSECGGLAKIYGSPHFFKPVEMNCPHCSNNGLPPGKVHRYWTPDEAAKEIKDKTGVDWEWPKYTAVWERSKVLFDSVFVTKWSLMTWGRTIAPYVDYAKSKNIAFDITWLNQHAVIAFPGQPAPAADWKPLPEPPKC